MKFVCRYICQGQEYFRTVWGDNPNEATKLAERFCKKGFMLHSIKSQ